jgi:paraquat-inducible protein A
MAEAATAAGLRLRACHVCGLIHRIPDLGESQVPRCTRCGSNIVQRQYSAAVLHRTVAFALTGLILFWPGVLLPILVIERFGHHHASGILPGCFQLIAAGELLVGIIILVFSVILPLVKLVLMLVLCGNWLLSHHHRGWTYTLLEQVGRWGMLDVLLVGILVGLIKLGDLVAFHVGPGAIFFVLCVAMSILAAASFDPHAVWTTAEESEESGRE